MANKNSISDELLAAYLEGNTTLEETLQVHRALELDDELQETLITSERVDSMFEENETEYSLLPMVQLAATAEMNLCDIQCEEYILRKLGIEYNDTDLSEKARENCWLKEKGTPLHSIGRLLEQKGLSVIRHYDVLTEDLVQALDSQHIVIVVVNANKLEAVGNKKLTSEDISYHAMVVMDYDILKGFVAVYDPATGNRMDKYSNKRFLEAWEDSHFYMVAVKVKSVDDVYNPQPIDLEGVVLEEDLLELREAIAENAHDVWAIARMNEGWIYGAVRDDERKLHPDLKPYADLPESEKQYDRDLAMQTIKLVKKVGYDLIKNTNTDLYKLLIRRLNRQNETYHCKSCGSLIFKHQVFCEHCGKKLSYKDYRE